MNVSKEEKEKVPKDESADRIKTKMLKGRIKRMLRGLKDDSQYPA